MIRLCANLSWLFQEYQFLARFAAARRAGFRAVECLFPYDTPAGETRAALASESLEIVLINTPPGDWQKGERGFAAVPGAEPRFRASLDQAIDYARTIGAPRIHVMAGLVPAGATIAACEAAFVENLRVASDRLSPHGLTATIEPLNSTDVPGYVLSGSTQARRIIDAVARPNVKLQWDAYHLQIMEGNLVASFERHLPVIGHVQIADSPARHEPGTGEINYPFVFSALDAAGYDGWVSLEYRPFGTTEDSLAWLTDMGYWPRRDA